ncbi:hypothetical protein NECID01_1942 [Nematocida sp. AWRm77]|nr:hypothetical protein NECID01_1942 [Nematocida sp. AWRm77]
MWTYERRNRARETLSKIVWASATGSIVGLSLGLLEKAVTGKGSVRKRTEDMMLLGGTYAIAESALEKWSARTTYTPIIAGCVAGTLSSTGTPRSIITTSVFAAALGYAIENREELLQSINSWQGANTHSETLE